MKKTLALLAMMVATTGAYQLSSNHQHIQGCGHGGFVPAELERQLFEEEAASLIDEKAFNEVIDKVSAVYAPIFEKKGATLKVNRLWTNNTINASAQQSGKTWIVNMYGGLARHAETTADGFALVLCHELGHHVGELPKYPNQWASNEGQSDYFGALKCFRKVYDRDDNVRVISELTVDPVAKAKCDEFYPDVNQSALCQRGAMAGFSLGRLLDVLGGNKIPKVKFETPDTNVVTATSNGHPKAQCRLDTYFAGALCPVDPNADLDPTDVDANACHYKGDKKLIIAARPQCWFKPALNDVPAPVPPPAPAPAPKPELPEQPGSELVFF